MVQTFDALNKILMHADSNENYQEEHCRGAAVYFFISEWEFKKISQSCFLSKRVKRNNYLVLVNPFACGKD